MIIKAIAAGFAWMLLLFVAARALRVRDDTPLDSSQPPEGAQYCVDVTENDSVCTTDPMGIWNQVVPQPSIDLINLGVEQRIDGTESEQNSIKDVIRHMNLYWFEEVLSNYEYDNVRKFW